MILEIDFFSFS